MLITPRIILPGFRELKQMLISTTKAIKALECVIDQPYEEENYEGGDKIVGLVVEKVVDHPVGPPARVVRVRQFKPGDNLCLKTQVSHQMWKYPQMK